MRRRDDDFVLGLIFISLLLLFIPLLGCSSTKLKVGVAHSFNKDLTGDNPHAIFELERKISEDITCSYWHISHYLVGPPINNEVEEWLDMVGCSYVIGGD